MKVDFVCTYEGFKGKGRDRTVRINTKKNENKEINSGGSDPESCSFRMMATNHKIYL